MKHWVDPSLRGIYENPAAAPPIPAPRHANDLAARQARLEEHVAFAASDRHRVEMESRLRAKDLGEAIVSLTERVSTLEMESRDRRRTLQAASALAALAARSVKYAAAALLGYLLLSGKASVEQVKLLLSALGFPLG